MKIRDKNPFYMVIDMTEFGKKINLEEDFDKIMHTVSEIKYGWSNSSFTEIFVEKSYRMLPIS